MFLKNIFLMCQCFICLFISNFFAKFELFKLYIVLHRNLFFNVCTAVPGSSIYCLLLNIIVFKITNSFCLFTQVQQPNKMLKMTQPDNGIEIKESIRLVFMAALEDLEIMQKHSKKWQEHCSVLAPDMIGLHRHIHHIKHCLLFDHENTDKELDCTQTLSLTLGLYKLYTYSLSKHCHIIMHFMFITNRFFIINV